MPERKRRLVNAAAGLPLVTLVAFYALIGCLRLSTGHWPSLNNPDPGMLESLPLLVLSTSILVLLLLTFISPFFVTALTVGHIVAEWHTLKPLAAFAASWGAWAILICADPGWFWFWYFD